jgi:hypothetical protein
MPKTPSHKLFRLVKSLSGPEKRYFKLFVGERDNKYIHLFDAIDHQEDFDEEALQQAVYAQEPIQSRKFSELKAYLYDLILRSLQAYDEKTSIEYRLKNLLLGVRTLYRRLLFEDCQELLQKARKLAYKYEKFSAVLEILDWEKQIAYARSDIPRLDRRLASIEQEERQCILLIDNILSFQNLFLKALVGVRKDALRTNPKGDELEELRNLPLLNNPEEALSYQARVLYFRAQSVLSFSAKDYPGFYHYGKQLIEIIESNPDVLREDVSHYISALSNLSVACGYLDRYEEVGECLEKLYRIKPNTLDDELKIHRQYYTNKFRLCIVTGEFEEGLHALERHLHEVENLDKQLFERGSFYFQYFYIYFGAGDYSKALDYLNKWLNLPRSIERQDLQSLARVLNLIIHYEMGNSLLLESLLRSTYRFLNKQARLHEFEGKVINFIREANRLQSRKELRQAFIELKKDFETLSGKQSEKAMLQLFDIESWLDSKIQNKPFAQIVKEKYLSAQGRRL